MVERLISLFITKLLCRVSTCLSLSPAVFFTSSKQQSIAKSRWRAKGPDFVPGEKLMVVTLPFCFATIPKNEG